MRLPGMRSARTERLATEGASRQGEPQAASTSLARRFTPLGGGRGAGVRGGAPICALLVLTLSGRGTDMAKKKKKKPVKRYPTGKVAAADYPLPVPPP